MNALTKTSTLLNGYLVKTVGQLEKFIDNNMNLNSRQVKVPTVPKKALFLQLKIFGDNISEVMTQRLNNVVKIAFNAASEVQNLFKANQHILRSRIKYKLPNFDSFMCIYQFDCSCDTSYTGLTIRRAYRRIFQHHPVQLSKRQIKSIHSSILCHLVVMQNTR